MKEKKYIITSNPIVIRQAVVYAKNEKEREVKFVGSGKWKILNEL